MGFFIFLRMTTKIYIRIQNYGYACTFPMVGNVLIIRDFFTINTILERYTRFCMVVHCAEIRLTFVLDNWL